MLASVTVLKQEVVELVLESGKTKKYAKKTEVRFQKLKQPKPKPANTSNAAPVISSVKSSNNAVFVIENDSKIQDFGIGEGWGKGASFGSGQKGGSVGFLARSRLLKE